jgi:hypothetical protein
MPLDPALRIAILFGLWLCLSAVLTWGIARWLRQMRDQDNRLDEE